MPTPATTLRNTLAGCLLAVAGLNPAPAQPAEPAMTQTVILVRHAEKSPAGGRDPTLSPAGEARAQALASTLAGAGVSAILVTPLQRTQLTAKPLAAARGLTPQVVPFPKEGGTAAHVAAVVAAVQAQPAGRTVLVVGHSNTVPAIVNALGGTALPDLSEETFNRLFVLLPGTPPRLIEAQYGAP